MSVLFDTAFRLIRQATEHPDDLIRSSLKVPQNTEYGAVYSDLPLAISHENATEVASEIGAAIDDTGEPLAADSSGAYLNFRIRNQPYYDRVTNGFDFSPRDADAGSVLIETAPPNIGDWYDPLLYRGVCVWDALSGIGSHLGYDVKQLLFWNDCGEPAGTAVARSATAGGNPAVADPDSAAEPASVLAAKLESDTDSELHDSWRTIRSESQRKLLAYLEDHGFAWDRLVRESETWEHLAELRERLLDARFVEVDEDESVLVRFPKANLPPRIAFRGDGASVYFTRDLAELQRRLNCEYEHCFYVVSANQEVHLEQLFTAARRLEFQGVDRCEHVAYGLVNGDAQTLSEFFDEVERLLAEDGLSCLGDSSNCIESVSRLYFLNRKRIREMQAFGADMAEVVVTDQLRLLYCRSRARTLVQRAREAEDALGGFDAKELRPEERALLKRIDRRWDVLEECFRARDPYPLVRYVHLLANEFNAFYQNCQVMLDGNSHPIRRTFCTLTIEVIETVFDILRLPPVALPQDDA